MLGRIEVFNLPMVRERVSHAGWNGPAQRRRQLWAALWLMVFTYVLSTSALQAQTISYIQGTYAVPQTPQSSVSVTFTGAQTAGDLIVAVVGWNDSVASVSTISDTRGNIYTRAVGPTILADAATQSIYYAKNIVAAAAGANTVTVTFSTAAQP